MDAVTVRAGQLILSVQTRWTASVGFCLRMAGEAVLTDFPGRDLRKGEDLGTISRINVRLPGSVAGFATLVFPAPLITGFKDLMRVLRELLGKILVTGAASGGADIVVFRRRDSSFLRATRGSREAWTCEPSQNQR